MKGRVLDRVRPRVGRSCLRLVSWFAEVVRPVVTDAAGGCPGDTGHPPESAVVTGTPLAAFGAAVRAGDGQRAGVVVGLPDRRVHTRVAELLDRTINDE